MRRAYRGDLWPDLEEHLVDEVGRARARDPLRPIDLLVGSNLLGLYLGRLLTRRFGAIAAVRPVTFLDLARRRAERALVAASLRPLPAFADELLIAQAVSGLRRGGYFEAVTAYPGFAGSLLATIRDLEDAGWSPADLRTAIGRGRLPGHAARKLTQLHDIYGRFRALVSGAGFFERADVLAAAAAMALEGEADSSGDRPQPGPGANGGPADGTGTRAGEARSSQRDASRPFLQSARMGSSAIVPDDSRQLPLFPEMESPGGRDPGAPPVSGEDGGGGARKQAGGGASCEQALASDARQQAGTGDERARAGGSGDALLLVYGFYDLIELQWRLLRAEARARETVVFVPTGGDETRSFARPLLDKLEKEGFVLERAQVKGAGNDQPGAATRTGVAAVRLLSAPGETREAAEVARQILAWAAEGIRFGEMAVLARRAGPSLLEISRALARAGVPFVLAAGRPFGETQSARAVGHLFRIALGGWERGDVVSFLAVAELADGLEGGGVVQHIPSSEWDLVSAEAGIVKGLEQWRAALEREIRRAYARVRRLAEQPGTRRDGERARAAVEPARAAAEPERPAEASGASALAAQTPCYQVRASGPFEDGPLRGRGPGAQAGASKDEREPASGSDSVSVRAEELAQARRRLEAARSLQRAVAAIEAALRLWPESGPWSVCAGGVLEAVRMLIRPSAERQELESIVEALSALDPIGPCPDRPRFVEIALKALSEHALRERHYEQGGVLVAEAEAVRGLSFRALALTGMVERIFPEPGREDPFLLDGERDSLARALPHLAPLPRKRERQSEERLLFRLVTGAARERLLLSWPRFSGGEDKENLPSPFVREAAAAPLPVCEVTPLFPLAPEVPDRALDAGEWVLARTARTARAGGATATSGERESLCREIAQQFPFLAGGLALERSRWEQRSFGPWDGRLDGQAAHEAFKRFLGTSISPTRIDEYAACPLQSFFGRVLRLRPLRDPAAVETIEPIERGNMVHAILASFLRALALEGDGLARLDLGEVAALRERLFAVARAHFVTTEERFPVGYALLWEIERERILGDLERWLRSEIEEARTSGFFPAAFEWAFGSRAGPLAGPALEIELPQTEAPPARDAHDENTHGENPAAGDARTGKASAQSSPAGKAPAEFPSNGADSGTDASEAGTNAERVAEGSAVSFHGRIDRIDLDESRRRARVIDYKTGRLRDDGPVTAQIGQGRAAQLPVYMLAAASLQGSEKVLEVASASYRYLREDQDRTLTREEWVGASAGFLSSLKILVAAARKGDFTADPRNPRFCQFCEFKDPCGEERARTFALKSRDPWIAARAGLRRE